MNFQTICFMLLTLCLTSLLDYSLGMRLRREVETVPDSAEIESLEEPVGPPEPSNEVDTKLDINGESEESDKPPSGSEEETLVDKDIVDLPEDIGKTPFQEEDEVKSEILPTEDEVKPEMSPDDGKIPEIAGPSSEDAPSNDDSKPSTDGKPSFFDEEVPFHGGFIFDAPIFSFSQVENYFKSMERAMENIFKNTMQQLGNMGFGANNSSNQVVEIDGRKYNVHTSVVNGGDESSSVLIKAITVVPVDKRRKRRSLW